MNIALSNIHPNPNRDLDRNPLNPEQITGIKESIDRTGFWDNVVVRKHPTKKAHYELAYGHNRMAALGCPNVQVEGQEDHPADKHQFIVKQLSDFDMMVAMIDENATQLNQTPKMVFENVTAAIVLAENLIMSSKNVTEFNEVAKTSRCLGTDNVQKTPPWRANEFEKAKACIEEGTGLGRGFLEKFLPESGQIDNNVLQAAIDAHYKESREAALVKEAEALEVEAEKLEAEAEEAEAEAEATNVKRDKVRSTTRATKSRTKAKAVRQKKAEKMKKKEAIDTGSIARELLEKLPTKTHMAQVAQAVKKNRIPSKHHASLIQRCIDEDWSTSTSAAIKQPVGKMTDAWWYRVSGKEEKDRKSARAFHAAWKAKGKGKDLDTFASELVVRSRDVVKELKAVAEFAKHIHNPTLRKNLTKASLDLELAANALGGALQEGEEDVIPDQKRLS